MSELCRPALKIKTLNCRLKDNESTTLTSVVYVTSSVTWPFDSRWAISYGWSFVTIRLSCTFMEIWCLKVGHWRTDERTHGRTLRWFYTLSNAMHCTGRTVSTL